MNSISRVKHFCLGLGFSLLPSLCFAAQSGTNSWEKALNSIVKSLTGPVIYSLSIMAIFICGIVMAFADLQGGARRFVQVACGLSIAIFSAAIVTGFIGFKGALI